MNKSFIFQVMLFTALLMMAGQMMQKKRGK
jgi:hypothetical protein